MNSVNSSGCAGLALVKVSLSLIHSAPLLSPLLSPLSCGCSEVRLSCCGFGAGGLGAVRSCSSCASALTAVSDSLFLSLSERRGGERGAAVAGQTGLVLAGKLAAPPRAAEEHDGETRAKGMWAVSIPQRTDRQTAGSL